MDIVSYNVNGIRAAIGKGLLNWMESRKADVYCFQETKAEKSQVDLSSFELFGYNSYWFSAQKKGYSGVAILTKKKPLHVEYGCGHELFDFEGRMIRVDFEDLSVISVYLPSGTTGDERQNVKYEFMDYFEQYTRELSWKYPSLVISGDYNICHRPIDIHNPKTNANSSGFLPEEREWMEKILNDTFIDSFRYFNSEPHQYTWWSFRAGSRDKNLGWRIDYHLVTKELEKRLKRAAILSEAKHSDHCPILLELK